MKRLKISMTFGWCFVCEICEFLRVFHDDDSDPVESRGHQSESNSHLTESDSHLVNLC
jgi:hypothetical protein